VTLLYQFELCTVADASAVDNHHNDGDAEKYSRGGSSTSSRNSTICQEKATRSSGYVRNTIETSVTKLYRLETVAESFEVAEAIYRIIVFDNKSGVVRKQALCLIISTALRLDAHIVMLQVQNDSEEASFADGHGRSIYGTGPSMVLVGLDAAEAKIATAIGDRGMTPDSNQDINRRNGARNNLQQAHHDICESYNLLRSLVGLGTEEDDDTRSLRNLPKGN
jgi:hypothetical protein